MQTESETIICARCGAENPAQRKTCQRCWGLLRGPICPHCGKRATRAGARFCEYCDGDLHAEPPAQASFTAVTATTPVAATTAVTAATAVTATPAGAPAREPAAEPPSASEPHLEREPADLSEMAAEPPAPTPPPLAPPMPAPPASPERVVVMGVPRAPAPAAGKPPAVPAVRPGDSRSAGPPPVRPASASPTAARRPVGLLVAATGLVIILGLAFLGGVALRRQQAAAPSPEPSPAPQAAVTFTPPALAAPATPSASPTAQTVVGGTLRVTTVPPGARVEMDGVAVGVTSLTLSGVAPGRRTVRISRNGYRTESRDFEIVAGETAVLNLTLSATPTPPAPRRRAPSGPPLPPPPLPPAPP